VSELFASGHIVDIVIALMVVEAAALITFHRLTGKGLNPRETITNLAAGICLFVALRLALTGAEWTWIGVALSAALLAHIADLTSRWRRD
jgi:hypothetical protein